MTETIASLAAEVELETGQAEGGLSNLEKSLAGTRTTLGGLDRDIKAFGVNLGSTSDLLKGMGVNLPISPMHALGQGIGFVAGQLQAAADETVAYAEQVRTLGRTIGATAEESSKLIQAADDTKVSYEALEAGLLAAIRNGVEPSIEGIGELSDQYLAIQDPIERTKFLMDNFGRSGAQLGPLMEKGADGIAALGAEAEAAGLVMSQDAVDAAREYELAIDDLNDKLLGLKVTIGQAVIPVLADFVEGVNDGPAAWAALNDSVEKGIMTQEEAARVALQLRMGIVSATEVVEAKTAANTVAADAETHLADRLRATATATTAAERATEAATARYQGLADAAGVAGQANFDLATAVERVDVNEDLMMQATLAARDAQAAAQASLDARVQGFYNLAAALKDTTAAELAQTQLKALDDMLAIGAITQAEYKTATENLGLAFGIFTPQSLELARASEQLVKWYAEGRITADELTTATGNLQQAAADGKVDVEELGISVDEKVTPAFASARDRAEEFEGVLDRLDGRTVTNTVHTYFTSEGQAAAIEAGGGYAPDYGGAQAMGGDYWVTSPTLFLAGEAGPERATFTPQGATAPAGDVPAGGNYTFNIYPAAGTNGEQLARQLRQAIQAGAWTMGQ